MAEIPYNYPEVSGTVIDLYCMYTETIEIPPSGYPATFRHPAPGLSVRAGEILSITADKTFNIRVDDGNGGTNSVRALRIKLASSGTGTTYEICQCYREKFSLADTIEVTAVTSDVYDDDDNLVLRGGTFHYTFAVIVYEKDSPYVQNDHFLEYRLGDEVHTTISGATRAFSLREVNYGVGGGISPEDRNFGGKVLANAQGYPSGLELSTIRNNGGVLVAGTASRPGLYWFRVWVQSFAESPHGTGEGANAKEFDGGENSEMFVVSIRPRSPVEGDLVLLVDAPIRAIDQNTFQVIYSEINNINDFQTYIISKEPTDVWEHHDELWAEPEVWTQPSGEFNAEFLEWLASLLSDEDEPGSGAQGGNSGQSSSAEEGEPGPFTGNVHLPGYWSRSHSISIQSQGVTVGALRWWYVICRDDDGYWRLYCALDTNATYSWFEMARVPSFGLDDEVPPKYWPSIKLCAKGSERYTVEGKGVFAWAGTFEYLPPGADENAEPITVEVYGQQPIRTPRYPGWTEYLPPEWQYNDNKLLYRHPEHGWVCVPSLDTEITAANVGQYRCAPNEPSKVAVPFSPARAPQSRGGLTFARDVALASSGVTMQLGQGADLGHLALLASVSGRTLSEAALWRYPLFRFWNLERFRMTIEVNFSVSASGGPVRVDSFDDMTSFSQKDAILGESPWSNSASDYPYPGYHTREKHHRIERDSNDVSGSYSATLRIENIPCYVSDYLLIACVAKGSSTTTASANIHGITGSVEKWVTTEERVYGLKDGDDLVAVNKVFDIKYLGTIESGNWFDSSSASAKCSASASISLGFGCDVSVCPVVWRGDKNRPRQARVFCATLGASCDWDVCGNGERDGMAYTSWESWGVYYDQNTGEARRETVPKPDDYHGADYETTVYESCSAGWDSGLVLWNENGENQIRADHTQIEDNFWKSASYYLFSSQASTGEEGDEEEEAENWSTLRHCDLSVSFGHVSGRTTWGEQEDGVMTKYPLQEISASAYKVDYDNANNNRSILHYDSSTGAKRSIDDVLDAYAGYRAWVDEIESPTLGHLDFETYPGNGVSMELEQYGYRSEGHREQHVSMTVTITDADPEPEQDED